MQFLARLLVVAAFVGAGLLTGYLAVVNAQWGDGGSSGSFVRDALVMASACLALVLLLTAVVLTIRALVLVFMYEEPSPPPVA